MYGKQVNGRDKLAAASLKKHRYLFMVRFLRRRSRPSEQIIHALVLF